MSNHTNSIWKLLHNSIETVVTTMAMMCQDVSVIIFQYERRPETMSASYYLFPNFAIVVTVAISRKMGTAPANGRVTCTENKDKYLESPEMERVYIAGFNGI